MKSLALSKQIIVIALLPALIVGIILSVYFTYDQLSFISKSQIEYGNFIIKQIQPVVKQAVINDDIKTLSSLLLSTVANKNINYIKISDTSHNDLITVNDIKSSKPPLYSIFYSAFSIEPDLTFNTPIYRQRSVPDNPLIKDVIANLEINLNTDASTIKKTQLVLKGAAITIFSLLALSLIMLRVSKKIISPIKALSSNVSNIAAGDLNVHMTLTSSGELGILENCINNMKNEIRESRKDQQTQLDTYTDELQQTLEELEIRNVELDIARNRAIEANKAKSEFLANMSHEIRTPLSGIIGFTELIQGTALSTQQKDYSTTIHKSAKHLLDIINDVLDLSKIESGKTDIIKSEFSLIDIVEDIITLSSTALEKNIELFYRIEPDVPKIIHSDPFRTHQVLTNLIGNAIKFTDSGYVYIQITLGEIKDVEYSIKFTVSDTGIGMNAEDKNNLFKAFSQADSSITRRFGGTGLGLIISRKLVSLMDGELGFDSTKDEGSTFWFSIPVTPVTKNNETFELKGKKVAFFSNNFIARQSYKTLFNGWQCQVTDYLFDNIKNISEIEKNHDIIVIFLGRKEINLKETSHNNLDIINNNLKFTIPSLLIASTHSRAELKKQQYRFFKKANFNSTALTSEKTEVLKQKIITLCDQDNVPHAIDTNHFIEAGIDWSDINIMVVDDNDVNLRLTEILLRKHNAHVITANSGEQAISYATKQPFDIIFMDLHMPGLDGYETTIRIRELTPTQKTIIIALTANAMPQEKQMVEKSGMDGILIKPISEFVLQKIISQWVTKGRKTDFSFDKESSSEQASKQKQDLIFSIDLAKKFTAGNEPLAYELFDMLQAELPNYKKAIITALKTKNLSLLHEQTHKLHGASRCCGTIELKEASSLTESLIKQEIDFDIDKQCSILLDAIQHVAEYKINH
jgi:two-component system sensor histidine kinase BarA